MKISPIIGNDVIHHFGQFLFNFELGAAIFGLKSGLGKSLFVLA